MRTKVIAVVIASGLCVLLMAGCKVETHEGRSGSQGAAGIKPEVGSACTVQLRRDALGASTGLIPPDTESVGGATVSVRGKFSRMDDNWVVLAASDKDEIWIPRGMILLIEVRK